MFRSTPRRLLTLPKSHHIPKKRHYSNINTPKDTNTPPPPYSPNAQNYNQYNNNGNSGKKSNMGLYLTMGTLGLLTGILSHDPEIVTKYLDAKTREKIHALIGHESKTQKRESLQRMHDDEERMRVLLREGREAQEGVVPKMRENAVAVRDNGNAQNTVKDASQENKGAAASTRAAPVAVAAGTAASSTTSNTVATNTEASAATTTSPINHQHLSLLEKKHNLLEELESELNHLKSFLIQTELYTQKRERQFDELASELSHVRGYLIDKEHKSSLKDQEISSLQNSLSTVQRKMENTIEQIKEEHKLKIQELEEVHRAELQEVESSIDVMLEDQRKILEQEYLKQNQSRIQKLRELTEKVYAVEESFHRSSSYLINSVRLQKITAAVLALQQVLKTDAPFLPEVKVLAEEGYGDRLIEEMVYAIPKEVQLEGLKRTHQLYVDFCNLDRKALEASYIPSTAGFFGLLYAKVVGKFLIQERGLVDGDTVDAKLARARVYLANQELGLAVLELSDITGEAREVLQPWLTQAQYRLIADQSVDILNAHITNLSASLVA